MAVTLLQEDSRDALDLIPVVLKAAEDFDKDAPCDEDYDKMMDHAESLADWLFGVSKSLIEETKILVRPDDGELTNFVQERHNKCILPSTEETANDLNGAGLNSIVEHTVISRAIKVL